MAKAYSHDGYCEPTHIGSSNLDVKGKIVIGGFILTTLVLTVVIWYGASIGIYPDPMYL